MGEYADDYIDRELMRHYDYNYTQRKCKWDKVPQGVKRHMIIRGKAKWAKVLGEPVWGYENTFKEWSIDVYVDGDTVERLKAEGLEDRIKDKGDGPFVKFSRKEFKQDGSPNKPIRVVDHKGEAWSGAKIGNGSTVNVNFAINEYKKGKFSANILSLQVWEHIPYTGGEFPTREDTDADGAGEDWTADEDES